VRSALNSKVVPATNDVERLASMQSAAKVMPYIDSNFDRMFISKSDNNNYHMAIVFELKKASAARNQ